MKEEKEIPQTELMVIFTDKDFRFTWAIDWDIEKLRKRASLKPKLIKLFWEQEKLRAYSGIAQKFPKNWKKFSDFQKVHKKWFFTQIKENEERQKKGKLQMTRKEWEKGMPKFISKIQPKDVKVIFVARDCRTWLQNFEDATYKKFERIIKQYKV